MSNPFELVADSGNGYMPAKELSKNEGRTVTVLGYFIDHKRVRTIKGENMAFGTFLDANLDWIDTVHFPDSLRYNPLRGKGFYKMTGKVVNDFGVYSVEVVKLEKVGYKNSGISL